MFHRPAFHPCPTFCMILLLSSAVAELADLVLKMLLIMFFTGVMKEELEPEGLSKELWPWNEKEAILD